MKLLYVLLLVITLKSAAQTDLFYKGSTISYINTNDGFTAISQKPVTNREYIIYLMWLRSAFLESYPDLFYLSVPGLAIDSLKMHEKKFPKNNPRIETILIYCKPFVREYMFNPRYLDYPVVGISWQNANNYAKWLSDRFNETTMMKKNILHYSPFPMAEDYFNTEAFIAGTWQGQLKGKNHSHGDNPIEVKGFSWSDHVFVPAFRLPSQQEVLKSDKTNDIEEFKAYPFGRKNILYKWNKQYFKNESENSYVLSYYNGYNGDTVVFNKTTKLELTGEMYLDRENSGNTKSILEIYSKNGQLVFGIQDYRKHMANIKYSFVNKLNPFIIIDEDKSGNPIYVSGYEDLTQADYSNFKYFRIACSMNEKQYAKLVEK